MSQKLVIWAMAITILVTGLIINERRRFIIDTIVELILKLSNELENRSGTGNRHDRGNFVPTNLDSFRIFPPFNIRPTSFWCRNGQCRYESLCYRGASREYAFLWHPIYSTRSPLNPDLFGRLSPVMDHNRFLIRNLVTVPWDYQLDRIERNIYWVPGQTMVMARFKPDNLLHLFHDDLLPLLATTREHGPFHNLFFDDHWPENIGHFLFQPGIIRLYRDHLPVDSIICFEQALIGLSESTLWYQYGFKKPQSSLPRTPEQLNYIYSHMAILRARILDQLDLNPTSGKCLVRHTLLIARHETRRILNPDQLSRYLDRKWSLPVHIIWIHDRGYLQNRDQFRRLVAAALCAQTVVAMHGSELMVALFVQPPEHPNPIRIVELFPYGIPNNISTVYQTLALILRYEYHGWTNPSRDNTRFPGDDWDPKHGGLGHLESKNRKLIKDSVDRPLGEFLCCDNPEWLYRIYQDTVVDSDSLDLVLREKTHINYHVETQPFHLSEVQAINCTFDDDHRMTVNWKPPWNLAMIPTIPKFVYEIAIQLPSSSSSTRIFKTKSHHEKQLSLTMDDCLSFGCHVWIKLNFENDMTDISDRKILSFYNRVPLFCIK